MADTQTTNLNLIKPEPGAAENTWGISLNSNLDALDAIFASGGTEVNIRFNSANFDDTKQINFGTDDDANIKHDGNNTKFTHNGTGGLYIGADTFCLQNGTHDENFICMTDNGSVELYHDNVKKLETKSGGVEVTGNISNVSGDMIIDVAADIVLDADGGNIEMKDDGLHFYSISRSGNNAIIQSVIQDGDVIIQGNDGGSTITALTLDMSEQGNATFNKNVIFGDNGKALFGAGTDLAIFSDGTNGKIEATGTLILDADGTTISLRDGGTENSQIGLDSAGLVMTVVGADKDFFISGNDGGSAITGVRVDFSDAGAIICNGNITAFGNTSDIRLKENIEVIFDALDKVKQLKGITFNYKKDGKRSTGLIAQDLEKVLPEAIYETIDADINVDPEEKHLAIRYGNTVGLLVEAIKELEARVKELEGK
tara:strand:+ start:846 stop:2126 length:1281 start_codon:yes stop_codon:yes gene_type:complete